MGLFRYLKDKFSKKENLETEKYVKGMEKSRHNFADKLQDLSKRYKEVNEDYFNELEEILISADSGVSFTIKVLDEVLEESKEKKLKNPVDINELLVDKMFINYAKSGDNIQNEINFNHEGPTVLLVSEIGRASCRERV